MHTSVYELGTGDPDFEHARLRQHMAYRITGCGTKAWLVETRDL